MAEMPTGTVTFLYTDLEGSTARWERDPAAMRAAAARHEALIRQAVQAQDGRVFRTAGDGLCAAFATAPEAVAAALAAQRALQAEVWGAVGPLRVRMALHTGAVERHGGDYVGACLNRVARLLAAGHGGQVLLSLATKELVRDALPDGGDLRDLGEHRLRDLVRPERVYQLLHAELPADFPPPRSLDAYPHNLPLQLTSFVGREQELAEAGRLLAATRLLTLTGTGGCGKTRLALHLAADRLDDYADGAWLAELAPLADPELVARAVAAVLQVSETPAQPLLTSLLAALRGKRLLLLLDNCEHLLDACARLVDVLLRGCPGLQVLATSREALGIAGETAWRVPSLASPDVRQLPPIAQLTQYQAVRLFIERATAALPGFAVTGQNAPAVAQLCWRLDGIPLAIELAAARVKGLSVEQLTARLDQRFRLLTGGSRTALPRQQTLRAAIDWSHELLTEPERVVLRRLSVFAGGCTLEAAEAVGAGDSLDEAEVLDLVLRLVDKSLVQAEPGAGGETRYRLLETIRQYARDRLLEAGEAETVRRRHRDWCLALVERAEPELRGRDEGAWSSRLDAELDNLRLALEWSRAEPDGALAELRLAAAPGAFWEPRGYLSEGRAWLEGALARVGAAATAGGAGGDRAVASIRAKALRWAGMLAWRQGDTARADALLREAVGLARELGDQPAEAEALASLGGVAYFRGDYVATRASCEAALARARAAGDRWTLAWTIWVYGGLLVRMCHFAEALPVLEEGVARLRELGDELNAQQGLSSLGIAALGEGDLARARAIFSQTRASSEQGGRWRRLGFQETNLGLIARLEGDHAAARRLYAAGLPRFRDAGDRPNIAWALEEWAGLAVAEGRPERAARLFGAAAALRAAMAQPRQPYHRAQYERDVAALRAALDEAALAAAWAAGRTLTPEQAIAEALAPEVANG